MKTETCIVQNTAQAIHTPGNPVKYVFHCLYFLIWHIFIKTALMQLLAENQPLISRISPQRIIRIGLLQLLLQTCIVSFEMDTESWFSLFARNSFAASAILAVISLNLFSSGCTPVFSWAILPYIRSAYAPIKMLHPPTVILHTLLSVNSKGDTCRHLISSGIFQTLKILYW